MKSNAKKILLMEDDEMLAQTLEQFLDLNGYDVVLATNGEEAIELTYRNHFDLYLLDINVPVLGGIDFLSLLREANDQTPAFFITAMIDVESVAKAFDSGCNDYIKKPFDIDELLIRIKSILKKRNPILEYQNITFDLFENSVFIDGEECNLGNVEKAVFALLIRNASKTVDKFTLFDVMNKPSESALRVLINKLRKTLDIEIINIKGIGYKLEKG